MSWLARVSEPIDGYRLDIEHYGYRLRFLPVSEASARDVVGTLNESFSITMAEMHSMPDAYSCCYQPHTKARGNLHSVRDIDRPSVRKKTRKFASIEDAVL